MQSSSPRGSARTAPTFVRPSRSASAISAPMYTSWNRGRSSSPPARWCDTLREMQSAPTYADVVLRDGSTMRFRPPGEGDDGALLAFFAGLSDQSLYLRFHGHPSVGHNVVDPLIDPDWDERGALVGTHEDRIVAVANYVRLRDRRTAEVAFAVADELQGRGIATRLLERLAAAATEA